MKIVIKISGEALKGNNSIETSMLEKVYQDLKELRSHENEIFVVVGGGNFFRGRNYLEIDNATKDYMGMLSTVMNVLALNNFLNNKGLKSKCFSSFEIAGIMKKYNYQEVKESLKDNIVILAGGLGVPNFSTDMVTIQKAVELQADLVLMGKNIDGIYDKDPRKYQATKISKLTHKELLELQLKNGFEQPVIDFEAMSMLCRNEIPLYLYGLADKNVISDLLNNKYSGTLVSSK